MAHKSGLRRARRGTSAAAAMLSVAMASGAVVATHASAAPQTIFKLDYWYQQSPGSTNLVGQWLLGVIPAFERAHPGVKVVANAISASEDDYYTKLDLLQSSPSTSPDVVMEDTFLIAPDESAGYLAPITQQVKTWPDWTKQFSPGMRDLTNYGGQVWGVPYSTDDRYLWYNASVFKQAGLPVPWHPTTWAQIMSTLQTIHQKLPSVAPMNIYAGVPNGEAATMQGFEELLYGTGYTLFDYHTNKWVVKDPGLADAFSFLYNVYHNGLGVPPSEELTGTWTSTVQATLLPKGQLAVDLDGNWAGPSSKLASWPSVLKYTAMPTMNGQSPGYSTLSGGWALSISKNAKNPALAWDYIKLASTRAGEAKINTLWGTLSPRADAATVASYAKTQPNLSFSLKLLRHGYFRPAFPVYPKVSYLIQQLTGDVISGTMTGAQAAAAFTQQVSSVVGAAHSEALTKPMSPAERYPSG